MEDEVVVTVETDPALGLGVLHKSKETGEFDRRKHVPRMANRVPVRPKGRKEGQVEQGHGPRKHPRCTRPCTCHRRGCLGNKLGLNVMEV